MIVTIKGGESIRMPSCCSKYSRGGYLMVFALELNELRNVLDLRDKRASACATPFITVQFI